MTTYQIFKDTILKVYPHDEEKQEACILIFRRNFERLFGPDGLRPDCEAEPGNVGSTPTRSTKDCN